VSDIYSLFPIPFFKKNLANINLSSIEVDKLLYHNFGDGYDFCTEDKYILENIELSLLKTLILQEVYNFGKKCLSITGNLKFTQSWIMMHPPGGYHRKHMHPNSVISGVFYLDVPDGSFLTVYKPTSKGNNFELAPPIDESHSQQNTFVQNSNHINVVNNDLVLFPSYLEHSVYYTDNTSNRYSLAFNVIPAEYFGNFYNLTEMRL